MAIEPNERTLVVERRDQQHLSHLTTNLAANRSLIRCLSVSEFAVKECLSNGTWYHRPFSDRPFTNYSRCPLGIPMDLLVSTEIPLVGVAVLNLKE